VRLAFGSQLPPIGETIIKFANWGFTLHDVEFCNAVDSIRKCAREVVGIGLSKRPRQ